MSRNRWSFVAVLAACLVSAAAVGAVASAAGSGRAAAQIHSGWLGTATNRVHSLARPSSPATGGVTIRAVFVTQAFRANTGDPGGFDEFAVSGPLRSGGVRIGFGVVRCAISVPAQGLGDCSGVFNLGGRFPNGSQITIQGLTSSATDWFNAVTGGTGRFANASGEVEAQNIATDRISLAFHIAR
jgi:hypothetical protein